MLMIALVNVCVLMIALNHSTVSSHATHAPSRSLHATCYTCSCYERLIVIVMMVDLIMLR